MARLNRPQSTDPSADDHPLDDGDTDETVSEDSARVNEGDADRGATATDDREPDGGSSPGDCESVGQVGFGVVLVLLAMLVATALLRWWSR